jgi:hypothetical protein
VEILEYLVIKHDGRTERFPVSEGEEEQALLRADLVRRLRGCGDPGRLHPAFNPAFAIQI